MVVEWMNDYTGGWITSTSEGDSAVRTSAYGYSFPACGNNLPFLWEECAYVLRKRSGSFFFFCRDLGRMGFMFHGNHMFHRSLTLPAREVWYQQAAGASDLTVRKQQIALGFFRLEGSQEPGSVSLGRDLEITVVLWIPALSQNTFFSKFFQDQLYRGIINMKQNVPILNTQFERFCQIYILTCGM